MTFLKIDNASKTYSGARALDGAHLEIAAGEVHALMGENGAGKSTLIKILAGVTAPDTLSISRDGVPIGLHGTADAFKHGFRFIHQELNIVAHLSVAENILLGHPYPTRLLGAVDWKKLNQLARAALDRLGVQHIDVRLKAARLSTGDRMLMKIASTLVADENQTARLYVMDEPTAALSGTESEKLFEVIRQLRQTGAAVLYVSHRMNEVMALCDRVTVLRDGRTVASKKLVDTSKGEIIRLMTGRDVKDAYPARAADITDRQVIEVKHVKTQRIDNINFTLNEGEILGVGGLAEAGQSALLQVLLGIDTVVKGRVDYPDGTISGPRDAWRHKLAYVPKERREEGLMLRRSIIDNINLAHLEKLSALGGVMSRKKERENAAGLSRQVQLKAAGLNQPCHQLSGGNQQKVVFARALGDVPRLLLLDEPTRGVDVGAKFDIYTLIRTMSSEGCAVIMTSSDLPELLGMCDRILIMRSGKQVDIVPTAGTTAADLLTLFYHQE